MIYIALLWLFVAAPVVAEVFNIEDFGAVAGGSPTANCKSINDAVRAAESVNGSVYVPARDTEFDVDCPITISVSGNNSSLTIYGDGRRSAIMGKLAGYLIERADGVGGTPSLHLRDLRIRNSHPQGSAIQIHKVGQSSILRTTIEANLYGIDAREGSTFGLWIGNNRIKSSGNPARSIGILAGGHTIINDENVLANWDDAIRYWGVGVKIENNRLEVNNRAIVAGMDARGASWIAHASNVSGNALEGNGTGLYIYNSFGGSFGPMIIQGKSSAPSGQSQYGVRIRSMRWSTLLSVYVSGKHDQFSIGFDVDDRHATVLGVTMLSVHAVNLSPTAPSWVLPSDMSEISMIQCNDQDNDLPSSPPQLSPPVAQREKPSGRLAGLGW